MSTVQTKPLSAWIAFISICFIWGTTYLGIKIGVSYMPSLFLAGFRNLVAGALLLLFAFFTSKEHPDKKTIIFLSFIGLLNLGMGNGLVTWAEEYVSSGLTALLCAMNPFWVTIFSITILRDAKLSWFSITGVIVGFIGIVGIFQDNLTDLAKPEYQLGIGLIVVANIAWGLGSVLLVRNKPKINVFYITGIQFFVAGIVLSASSIAVEPIPSFSEIAWQGWAALIYLILFGSIIAYIAYMHALKFFMPTRVSIYAYINPLVALWLGWLILDEQLTPFMLFSAILTVIGVWMVNRGYAKAKIAKIIGE